MFIPAKNVVEARFEGKPWATPRVREHVLAPLLAFCGTTVPMTTLRTTFEAGLVAFGQAVSTGSETMLRTRFKDDIAACFVPSPLLRRHMTGEKAPEPMPTT